jgi:hypothetical protein
VAQVSTHTLQPVTARQALATLLNLLLLLLLLLGQKQV